MFACSHNSIVDSYYKKKVLVFLKIVILFHLKVYEYIFLIKSSNIAQNFTTLTTNLLSARSRKIRSSLRPRKGVVSLRIRSCTSNQREKQGDDNFIVPDSDKNQSSTNGMEHDDATKL